MRTIAALVPRGNVIGTSTAAVLTPRIVSEGMRAGLGSAMRADVA